MSDWKKINIHENAIITETEKAVLIKVKGSKKKFWHPRKLIRNIGGGMLSMSYTDDFEFTLFRNGEGQYNWKTVIESSEYSPAELIRQFYC